MTSADEKSVAFHAGITPKSSPTSSAAPAQKATTRMSKVSVTVAGSRPCGMSDGATLRMAAPTADPKRAADQREHDAFGQQLPDDAPAAGAERGPHRQLARAHGRAREQQVGDVGAADEEHESDDAEEQHRREPQIAADHRVVQPLERRRRGPCWSAGTRARAPSATAPRSASAALIETPGFRRPTTCST